MSAYSTCLVSPYCVVSVIASDESVGDLVEDDVVYGLAIVERRKDFR